MTTNRSKNRTNLFGLMALGVMAAVLAVPATAIAAGNSGGFSPTQMAADAGGKDRAAKQQRKADRRAAKQARNSAQREARQERRANNRAATQARQQNRQAERRSNPTPNFLTNDHSNHPHVRAMGQNHPQHRDRGNQTYRNHGADRSRARALKEQNKRLRNLNKRVKNQNKLLKRGSYGYRHGEHHGYGYGGHLHRRYYNYGHGHHHYKPRSGWKITIGTGGVFAGYSTHRNYVYGDYDHGYCSTTVYKRYGHHGTTTYRRTYCTSDVYGGYTYNPTYVNNTYVYGGTDAEDYRDYQVQTYTNNRADEQVYDSPEPEPEVQVAERVGMVGPWADLVNSQAARAQDIFDQIATDYPDDGLPQLGFAIASAQQGQYDSAAAAVMRALEIDPAAVDRMPDSVALRAEIRDLAEQVRRADGQGLERAEYWTLVATFDYLSGDPFRAKAGIEQAAANGADLRIVTGLQDRIER